MGGHTPAYGRGFLLLLGAAGWGILATWARHLTWQDGAFALSENGVVVARPATMLVLAVMLAAFLGVVGFAGACLGDPNWRGMIRWIWGWIKSHPLGAGILGLAVLVGTVDVYEIMYDPFNKKWGPFVYMLRDDLQAWMFFAAAILGGLALSAIGGWTAGMETLERGLSRRWLWGVAVATPVVLAAVMCRLALDGVPHFSDACTYMMQGRILWSGALWIPAPRHPELYINSLYFLATDGRFYGKYPLGWPLILGMFDKAGLMFLANATLTGLGAALVGWLGCLLADKRVGTLAALVFGLSTWVWFHGADMASHVASMLAVTGFLACFIAMWQGMTGGGALPASQAAGGSQWAKVGGLALAAGLFLGWGVLVRPGDAANFALPAIAVVLGGICLRPVKWLPAGTVIALGALLGVGIYLWSNAQTTGQALVSPYKLEGRWQEDWNPTASSMLGRMAFQWADLNGRFPGWGLGGMTLALMGAMAWWGSPQWKEGRKAMGLVLAGTGVFFVFNTAFGFTNVWWGPRWLLPVAPALSVLIAMLGVRMLELLREGDEEIRQAARMGWMVALAGVVGVGLCRYTGKCLEVKVLPPHGVTTAVMERVQQMGLKQAVVGMASTGGLAPPDTRSGITYMQVPWEKNQVIYVRKVEGWEGKARASYPDREVYDLVKDKSDPNGFIIHHLKP